MQYSIGVDLGGTDIKAGLVSSDGDISCRVVLPTDVKVGGPKVVAARIAEAVRQVLVKSEQTLRPSISAGKKSQRLADVHEIAVGLGAPGLIIAETGVIHFSPNFPGWSDIPLVDYVNTELAKLRGGAHNPEAHTNDNKYQPVLKGMDNDVNAMTLGELLHGAADLLAWRSSAGAHVVVCGGCGCWGDARGG